MVKIAPGTLLWFVRNRWLAGGLDREGVEVALDGACNQRGGTGGMMRTMNSFASLSSLLTQPSFDFGPVFAPTLRA